MLQAIVRDLLITSWGSLAKRITKHLTCMSIPFGCGSAPFETADINIAATILAFGVPLAGINRNDPDHCVFEFDRAKRANEIARKYWARKLMIEPFVLLSSLKSLKSQLYSERV